MTITIGNGAVLRFKSAEKPDNDAAQYVGFRCVRQSYGPSLPEPLMLALYYLPMDGAARNAS
jgi:hypothetical protein